MIDMGKERPWICSYQNWVNYAMSYHVLFLYQNKTTSVETVLQSVSAFLIFSNWAAKYNRYYYY